MFDVLLGLIIILGSGILGIIKSVKFNLRFNELNMIRNIFHQLNTEMSYRKDPMKQIFKRLALNNKGPGADMLEKCAEHMESYQEFDKCWYSAVNEVSHNSCLNQKDIDILCELGLQLGKSSIDNQKKLFDMLDEKLMYQIKDASKDKETKGKMYRGIGFSMGILLTVLIL